MNALPSTNSANIRFRVCPSAHTSCPLPLPSHTATTTAPSTTTLSTPPVVYIDAMFLPAADELVLDPPERCIAVSLPVKPDTAGAADEAEIDGARDVEGKLMDRVVLAWGMGTSKGVSMPIARGSEGLADTAEPAVGVEED
jgi:hypothetical protein